MTPAEIGRRVAELLFRAGSIHVSRGQPFMLAAGWASPVYVDCRLLVGEPEIRQEIIDLALRYADIAFTDVSFDAIVGAETAGIPFAAWLADRRDLPMRYVRKRPLGIGRHAQVEGGSVEGLRVLLIDDLTTDGGSKLGFARGLRAAGAKVDHILSIFYHDAFPGATQRLAAAGLELHALATWKHILEAHSAADLSAEDRDELQNFLADPIDWSMRHGGRASLTPAG